MRRLLNRKLSLADLPEIKQKGQNKPSRSAFFQQKLRSHWPLLTLPWALIITAVVETILVIAGIALYVVAFEAKQGVIEYTHCTKTNNVSISSYYSAKYADSSSHSSFLAELRHNETSENKTCFYDIELQEDYNGDVRFYYGLENYYQNTRFYFRSRNDIQLQGKKLTMVEDCSPYDYVKDAGNKTTAIAPCGFVANSLFNDTFTLEYKINGTQIPVPWTTQGLLDPKIYEKYVNPPIKPGETLCDAFKGTKKPIAWHIPPCELDDGDGGIGFQNFDFMIWMQTAALPKFRKLYRALNKTEDDIFENGLPKGSYVLKITDNYPVDDYDGKKRFIIGIGGLRGQKNYFLPLAFFTTALGIFFITVFLLALKCCHCDALESKLQRVAHCF
uniref:Cell cycle control protein n=1 Tax=Panagrolaimus sp. JU765 TaxID=591449 RepID=A0AC34RJ14_9BILA